MAGWEEFRMGILTWNHPIVWTLQLPEMTDIPEQHAFGYLQGTHLDGIGLMEWEQYKWGRNKDTGWGRSVCGSGMCTYQRICNHFWQVNILPGSEMKLGGVTTLRIWIKRKHRQRKKYQDYIWYRYIRKRSIHHWGWNLFFNLTWTQVSNAI